MSSPAFERGPGSEPAPRPSPPPAQAASDRTLLERVLEQTLSEQSGGSELPALEALRNLAAQYAGRPFELEPMAVELVEAFLRMQLQWRGDVGTPALLAREIARTLFEDPVMHDRLEALWCRLCKRQP